MKFITTYQSIVFILFASIFSLVFSLLLKNNSFFLVGEFLAGLVGLLIIVGNFVYLESQFHFLNILAASTLVATGFGTINTYTDVPEILGVDWSFYVGSIGLSFSSITTAQLIVNFYCLFLLVLGCLSNKYLSFDKDFTKGKYSVKFCHNKEIIEKIHKISLNPKKCIKLLLICSLISVLQALIVQAGFYTFQGLSSEQGVVNPFAVLVASAAPFTVFSLGLLSSKFKLLQTQTNKYFLIFIYSILTFIQLIFFVGSGRRNLVYAVVLFLFGLRFSQFREKINLHTINKKNVRLLLCFFLLLPIVYFSWKIFIFIRVKSYSDPLLLQSNLFDIMTYAFSQYFSSDNALFLDEVQQHESSNLATRAFVLNYLAQLVEYQGNKPPLFGQDIFSNLLNSLPRFFYGDKSSILLNEALYNYKYGILPTDNANSLYFSAYGDFSWLGTLIYPLILFLLLDLSLKVFLASKSPYFIILAVASLIQLFLGGGESSLTTFIVAFRNLFILLIILKGTIFFLSLMRAITSTHNRYSKSNKYK
ncbi:hypothetical protein C7B80_16935 [Cyanosarcina cf. burmensis CCALA 770]|nr:hypothetical protein C7B80_16935 [Cyanosarcina cf. burmensis CCALA 770]